MFLENDRPVFDSLIEAFSHQVRTQPDRMALVFETPERVARSMTWRQLAAVVARCASELSSRFEASPEMPRRIGHASDNGLADITLALASMSIGAVEVPIDHRLSEEEIRERWNRVGGLWVDPDWRRQICFAPVYPRRVVSLPRLDIDSPSLILWTSGTTGSPQGVTLSQRNLTGNAAAKLAAVPQRSDDIRLSVLPLSHAYARTCDFGTWLLSGSVLALTLGYAGLRRLAPLVQPTLMNTVPSLAIRALDDDPQECGLQRLRLLGCGGAAIPDAEFLRWKERGTVVIQGYGLTEASPVICSATPEDAAPGLVGRPVQGWETEIREGQLFVRGPHTMLGYWDDPHATGQKIDREGWLATGDLVDRDLGTDGQFRVRGRADDVIVLGTGRKIFPATIQSEVEQIRGVHHAVLVHNDELELWIDADEELDQDAIHVAIAEVLARHPGCRNCGVHRFTPPLCEASGELTVKGTVRRNRIIKNRFLAQAGS